MNIIFQDIDGPLIPLRMYFGGSRPFNLQAGSFVYDPVAVGMLNHLCEKFGARVVFNSAHNENPHDRMKHQGTVNGLKYLHDDCKTDYNILITKVFYSNSLFAVSYISSTLSKLSITSCT